MGKQLTRVGGMSRVSLCEIVSNEMTKMVGNMPMEALEIKT